MTVVRLAEIVGHEERTVKRIAIVGCSGGGKSTLARALGAYLGLPVVHFDALFWKPGWVESDREAFRAAIDAALAGERWVSDGNFTSVADISLARADTIVWIDQPIALCLRRAVCRAVTGFGRTRADLASGCPERIDFAFYHYILTWNRLPRSRLQIAIDVFGRDARLIWLRSDREIASWLTEVAASRS
jgi:adenylate kinase family enzyme